MTGSENAAGVTFTSAMHFPLTALAETFVRAFEGYFVHMSADPAMLSARVRQEQIDLAASLIALGPDGEAVGITLVARRGAVSRVAGMGVTAAWRGRGVGDALLARALREARGRGDAEMRLEVIEQNVAARRLYEKHGFATTRRLVGYEAAAIDGVAAPLEPISITDVAERVAVEGDPALPWQLAPATLGAVTPPAAAFRLGPAWALVSVTPETVALRALLVDAVARQQGHGKRLLRGLADRFPGRRFAVPALIPETLADAFFLASGFSRAAITQLELTHTFGKEMNSGRE